MEHRQRANDLDLPPVRSALFVPAHRQDYLAKADSRGADAVILDLEDSVAEQARDRAVEAASRWIANRPDPVSPVVIVRINPLGKGRMQSEVMQLVSPNLTAVQIPKVDSPQDIRTVSEFLGYAEGVRGLDYGRIRVWPLIESATAVQRSARLARCSSRVAFMGGGAAEGGDLAASVGFRGTASMLETHPLRAKVLLDARAAGVPNPMSGIFVDIGDLDGLRRFAVQNRDLGYEGMMVIHPAHVDVVNQVFGPSEDELEEAEAIVAAVKAAGHRGDGAATVRGRMVDEAHAKTARRLLARAGRQIVD
ncbi:MAG TPA: CoA ester lyase [Acidimicrobiales bacterium]|nr:CoA ester lyase [Acidimicrobiales bacterium]